MTSHSLRLSLLLSLLFLHLLHVFFPLVRAFNASCLKPSDTFTNNSIHVLEDILKEVAAKQKWDMEANRLLKLDIGNVRFGIAERCEIRVGFGKTKLLAKFSDEVASWKKRRKGDSDFGSLVKEVGSMAVLSTFKVDGPFDLRVDGNYQLSLTLPMNITHGGLNRIIVGDGITIEVSGAQEVSAFHSSDLGTVLNRTTSINKEKKELFSFWRPICLPLLPVRIVGSAKLVAYSTRNPSAFIRTTSNSREMIGLLPDKCRSRRNYMKNTSPVDSIKLRMNMLEEVLRHSLSGRLRRNVFPGFVKGVLKASAVIRFHLEIERDIGWKDNLQVMLAEWRTRPSIEHVWYEVLARVEGERLRPVVVKKVKPFIAVDSAAWSNLMFNISFTKFPSLLVPPESLTLDVKW